MDLRFPICDLRLHERHGPTSARPSRSSFVTRHSSFAKRGFSFTELLFAVMILGIGFILIAAIFPVGLSQTKSNFDETQAASLARAAAAEIGRAANDTIFPSTGNVARPLQVFGDNSVTNETTKIALTNMISPSDSRYACVPLYRRAAGSGTAQLCMFIINRSDPIQLSDLQSSGAGDVAWIEPRRVEVDIIGGVVTLRAPDPATGGESENVNAAAPGSFLLIADDNGRSNGDIPSADRPSANGRLNGRVYRLGTQTGAGIFEMFPGAEFEPVTYTYDDDGDVNTPEKSVTIPSIREGEAYIVGRNRTGVGNNFEGTTMDVAYYTTFISLK